MQCTLTKTLFENLTLESPQNQIIKEIGIPHFVTTSNWDAKPSQDPKMKFFLDKQENNVHILETKLIFVDKNEKNMPNNRIHQY